MSEPETDELVKRGAVWLSKESSATLDEISLPMHLDGKMLILFVYHHCNIYDYEAVGFDLLVPRIIL